MTFRNEATRREREEILKNDLSQTLHGRAQAQLEQERSGRFAKPSTVTGAAPSPQAYPGAAWTQNVVPPEPPLGVDVNFVEAVGEKFEIERSIAQAEVAAFDIKAPGASSSSFGDASVERSHPVKAAPTPSQMTSAEASTETAGMFGVGAVTPKRRKVTQA